MSLLYTPQDIAVFLIASNFTQSDERRIIASVWENKKQQIARCYQRDFLLFRRHILNEISLMDGGRSEIDELNILMRDSDHQFIVENISKQQGIIESYFKTIKLGLRYVEGRKYRKIKLRRLLRKFGYKRRSAQLVAHIKWTLSALELKTYLRGYVPCDIAKINIDDVVIIRLV